MDSFFFNITDSNYKITNIYTIKNDYVKRVDISNGAVFFDIDLQSSYFRYKMKNLDRMVMIVVTKEGCLTIENQKNGSIIDQNRNSISLFYSSRQDFILSAKNSSKIFILFIADFFLKRYLQNSSDNIIDFLYHKLQEENYLQLLHSTPIDALSLYLIEKILEDSDQSNLLSIKKEHLVNEFLIHRLSLVDSFDKKISKDELKIAKRAKNYLLKNFINAPTIDSLAKICATNETKLKKVFKKVYNSTIYQYIQKLRLEEANRLLIDGELNIGCIAKKVGYNHQSHFSKLFYEHYGVYPKELLKKSL